MSSCGWRNSSPKTPGRPPVRRKTHAASLSNRPSRATETRLHFPIAEREAHLSDGSLGQPPSGKTAPFFAQRRHALSRRTGRQKGSTVSLQCWLLEDRADLRPALAPGGVRVTGSPETQIGLAV